MIQIDDRKKKIYIVKGFCNRYNDKQIIMRSKKDKWRHFSGKKNIGMGFDIRNKTITRKHPIKHE